jgi:type III restriction enzyme
MKGSELSLQIDVTATPKHNNGAIFVQTVSDYPLVEAIYQDVVKHPVSPDSASRAKLQERQSSKFTERYADYLHLGYLEWQKVYEEHKKLKKAVLFVMTDDTKNCDEVSEYLQTTYPDLKDAVLTIHTKDNGEISESATGKSKEELDKLRKESNEIDTWESPYKVIVSVLMLKEGWDVRNVTTIVGLRAYSSKANILPEQTLGRGLRRMYRGEDIEEFVSVVGTDAFMDFVESIKSEGVELERKPMGGDSTPKAPIVVEIDRENMKKDIDNLDIEIPIMTPRIYREYKNLSELNPTHFGNQKLSLKEYSEQEKREIVFKHIVKSADAEEEIHHKTVLDSDTVIDYQSVIGYFTRLIMRELRLVSGYDILYEKVKSFIQNDLFNKQIDLEDLNVLRNLSEVEATRTVLEMFKKAINNLTVLDRGDAEIREYIKISKARPFVAKDQGYIVPQKSVFNKVIGDSHFELEVASLLERCSDIISYAKNYFSVHFKIDYRNADGAISDYYPDFVVKISDREVCIVETKGREDLDDILKIERLKQWCDDVNKRQDKIKYSMLYVKQEDYEKFNPQSFGDLVAGSKND